MINKLPPWVEYGAFILSLVAGFINAVGLLGFKHQSISHLSGTATLLGTGMISSNLNDVFHLFFIMLSFLVGAITSGYFLQSGALKLGRNYSGLLSLEAIILLGAIYFLKEDSFYGHYFASAACGLQNALVTTYSGAVVRTTHVTGIFTDLGILLGSTLRGKSFDKRKALLFLIIILGFIFGGTAGGISFGIFEFYSLFIPVSICLSLAIFYSIYNSRMS